MELTQSTILIYGETLTYTEGTEKKRSDLTKPQTRWVSQNNEKVQALVQQGIGFRRLFSALSAAGRPLVVHNGLYDLLFLMHYFHAPLPPSLDLFKRMVRQTLGDIYDTKVLVNNSPSLSKLDAFKSLAGSSLSDVWALIRQHSSFKTHPQIHLPTGFRRYHTKSLHDAAWDSLATGEVFAKVSRLVPEEEAARLRGQVHRPLCRYTHDEATCTFIHDT